MTKLKTVPEDFQDQVMRELSVLTLVKLPSPGKFTSPVRAYAQLWLGMRTQDEDLLNQLLEQNVKPKPQKNLIDAQKILKQKKILEHLCPALQTASNDVFALAKIITPILVSLELTGITSIPLSPVLFANISIIICRMGISGLCSQVSNIQLNQRFTIAHKEIEEISTNNQRYLFNIIEIKMRRLQILKQQRAYYGIICPPQIILEIEDIHQDINTLVDRLKENTKDRQPTI